MKFYLIHPKEKRSSIFADINYKKLRLRLAVGIVVNSDNWLQRNEKVSSKEENYTKINARLGFLRSTIELIISDLKLYQKQITLNEFKTKIEKVISPGKGMNFPSEDQNDSQSLIVLMKDWISDRVKFDKRFGSSTREKYKYLEIHLVDFMKYQNCLLTPMNIDESFYKEFSRYLMVVKDQVDTTIGSYIKCLKTLLHSLELKGFKVNPAYKKFYVYQDKKSPTIALSEDDMKRIEDLDLTSEPLLNTVRDIIYVQYQTVQRVSDLFQLRKEHFDFNARRITITQRKTKTTVVIGLTKRIEEIFIKYNYRLPFFERRQYNDRLKMICKKAGITNDVEIVRNQGKSSKRIVKPKNELIASHAIRRAAITHLLRKGCNPDFVMKVAGIKSLVVFEQYKKYADHEASDAVRLIWDNE